MDEERSRIRGERVASWLNIEYSDIQVLLHDAGDETGTLTSANKRGVLGEDINYVY